MSREFRIENWELRSDSWTEPPGGRADRIRSSMVQFKILNSQFSIS